jgi:hypothetical protein
MMETFFNFIFLPVIWRWKLLYNLSHEDESLVFLGPRGFNKLVVEVVRAKRIGKFAEIHFKQRRN